MRTLLSSIAAVAWLTLAASAAAQARDPNVPGPTAPVPGLPAPVLLWPDGAPGAKGTSEEDQPALYPFLPSDATSTGTAIIVAPGGAFTHRAADYEGVTVAQWLRARGIAAFVLRYRIMPLYTRGDAVNDGARAVQHVRLNAAKYRVSPRRVGMIGFSAGAELAQLMVVQAAMLDGDARIRSDDYQTTGRPDFLVLAYGAVSQVVKAPPTDGRTQALIPYRYPPTFMFCTEEDASHLAPMLELYAQLRWEKANTELHVFPAGEHGVGLAAGDRALGEWPNLMMNWLRSSNLLTDATRAAVRGRILLDGASLPHGSVTFVPIDGETPRGAAAVTAYVMNTNTPDGEYWLDAAHGPVPGRYRVEVRQDAVVWVSNSRDPAQRLPLAERQAFIRQPGWGAPTIDDIRLFTRRRPNGPELVVEIGPGENNLDIEVASR